ncbi:hypothetical protein EV356DRAFT_580482 [Viridothelium virens]|uniref:Uncharacterized protein n=1 Tax=Viridothelium virens TaxID=1048519 RepID=A0A6A6GW69_VIRVR|nr:hypothetical protein EV356DRAFT_580482 [Viridothelium virens]
MAPKNSPFYPLRDLLKKICNHPSTRFSSADLEVLRIDVTDMDAETGKTKDSWPQYATPFPKGRFESLLEERSACIDWNELRNAQDYSDADPEENPFDIDLFDRAYNTEHYLRILLYRDAELIKWSAYQYKGSTRGPYEHLFSTNRFGRERWEIHGLLEARDPSKPHMTCLIMHDSNPDEESLFRCELYGAVSLMAGRLGAPQYGRQNAIAPIIVCTLAGDQARIIQAHFDPVSCHLIVRKTKGFTVPRVVNEGSFLLLRWMMNEPCGDTLASTYDGLALQ